MITSEELSLNLVCPYDKSAVAFEYFPEARTGLVSVVDRGAGEARGVTLSSDDVELLRDWCSSVLARAGVEA